MAEVVSAGGGCGSAEPAEPAVSRSFAIEEYECKICYNLFDLDRHLPKLLSCSHTFCQECLEILHSGEGRGWRIGCPVCRHRTPVRGYQVRNLPDNTSLTEVLPVKAGQYEDSSNTDEQRVASVSSATIGDVNASCESCKHVVFTTCCVCAIFSFVSTAVLLIFGLIFIHNFPTDHIVLPIGPACLFGASVCALFSLIFTWLMCLLRLQPETEINGSMM
ncbi:RING finger protein 228-like [Odontesthes bonariensis]|uniref:RING finger protein 228-like n=1 Tax=Odontesthes bonariensis TaxID=219752 RepID=UPI003F58E424